MSYDPQAKGKALRARINTEKPTSETLQMILTSALAEAYEAGTEAHRAGRLDQLTPQQQKRAVDLLPFIADGCSCGVVNRCVACHARDLLKELGYAMNAHGNWSRPT
jgi:hypothetical protein